MGGGNLEAVPSALVDLDGVVWLSGEPIGNPAAAVADLRRDHEVAFVTNNAVAPRAVLLERLAAVGIEVGPGGLFTPADVIAGLVEPGQRVLSLSGPGVAEALVARGAELVEDGNCEVVVVGLTDAFDAGGLAAASTAIRAGARFLATNLDPTHPTPKGLMPGSGAIVAAVATAAEQAPEVCGKPAAAMVAHLSSHLGSVGLVVGDRLTTDGALARELGAAFLFVDAGTEVLGGAAAAARGATLEAVVTTWRQLGG